MNLARHPLQFTMPLAKISLRTTLYARSAVLLRIMRVAVTAKEVRSADPY
jgi:hypothetical protein